MHNFLQVFSSQLFRSSFKGAAKGLALRYQASIRDYMVVISLILTYILLFLYMSARKKKKTNCLERHKIDAIWNKVCSPLPDCDSDIRSVQKNLLLFFFLFFYFFGDIKTQGIENGHTVGSEKFPLRVKRETDELSKKQDSLTPYFPLYTTVGIKMNASRWGMEKFAAANTEVVLLSVTVKARTVSISLCTFVLLAFSRLISQASAHAWPLIHEKS